MEGYKSSIQRLANLFKRGRDAWKQRAAEKQKKPTCKFSGDGVIEVNTGSL